MAWTDKMVEDLKIMWKQGLTTGEIGKRLGVSKNSIVGKVHRLQLDARPSPIKKKDDTAVKAPVKEKIAAPVKKAPEKEIKKVKEVKKEEKVEKAVFRPIAPPSPAPKAPIAGNIKLANLDNHTCRWPIGDPKDENFHFCGKRIKVGQTYCDEHAAVAYVKPNAKK